MLVGSFFSVFCLYFSVDTSNTYVAPPAFQAFIQAGYSATAYINSAIQYQGKIIRDYKF